MIQKIYGCCLLILVLGLAACGEDQSKNIPDVSQLQPDFKLIRFEQELFALDTNKISGELQQLETKHPAFFNLYFTYIVPFKNQTPARPINLTNKEQEGDFEAQVAAFISAPPIRKLKDTIDTVFGDFSDVEAELTQGFQFFQHYFPERDLPNVYTLLSEYAFQNFVFEDQGEKDGLGIGLDFFLGADYPYQQYNPKNAAFSAYLVRSFNKQHLTKKTFEALVSDLAERPGGNRLIDLMIHNGKQLYILDQLLPYTADSVKLEYSTEQLKWVEENEFNIWAYLIDEGLIYSSNMREIQKLVNPSPHSPGMPPEAPGRTANWLGWQIVKSYMKRHPDTSLQQLLAFDDAQKLLDLSKYKPRRQ
ncbi:MAG: hypothetical protein AAFO94_06080 [Bacteroidota bacterium]